MEFRIESRQKLGFATLILMQLASLVCMFVCMSMMDQIPYPTKPTLLWSCAAMLGMMFPILTAHFHTMYLHRKVGWLNWWLTVSATFPAGLLFYDSLIPFPKWLAELSGSTRYLPDSMQEEITTWFLCTSVGGTLGSLIVFGMIRRFAPSFLSIQKPITPVEKPKTSLKTLFFWMTAVAIFTAAYLNAEALHLNFGETYQVPFIGCLAIGVFTAGGISLLVFLPMLKWVQSLKPFWFSVLSLAYLVALTIVGLIAIISVVSIYYEVEAINIAFYFSTYLAFILLNCAMWIYAWRLAGILPTLKTLSLEEKSSRGFMRKSSSGINWLIQRTAWLALCGSMIYAIGWSGIHFGIGGPERDRNLIVKDSLAESNNWLESVNAKWSEGVTKENNIVVGLLRLTNPLNESDNTNAYYKRLGLSDEEVTEIESVDFLQWFEDKIDIYKQSLEQQFPEVLEGENIKSLLGYHELYSRSDPGFDHELFLARRNWEKEAFDLYSFCRAPWNKKDCALAAEFIESHTATITQLKQLSKESHFFSPNLNIPNSPGIFQPGDRLNRKATDLLQVAAMYHVGSDNVDVAVEDCKAIFDLARPDFRSQFLEEFVFLSERNHEQPGRWIALQIACSGKADAKQMKQLLSLISTPTNEIDIAFQTQIKDAVNRQTISRLLQVKDSKIYSDMRRVQNPMLAWYHKAPSLVDWEAFNQTYHQLRDRQLELIAQARAGEMDFRTFYNETTKVSVAGNTGSGKLTYYGSFGVQLATWLKGPKSKGQALGNLIAGATLRVLPSAIFHSQAQRSMERIAIALEIYNAENGNYPSELNQLAPAILETIPYDPYTGNSFIYSKTKSNYLLYSVGRNQRDDGAPSDSNEDVVFYRPYKDMIEYYLDPFKHYR